MRKELLKRDALNRIAAQQLLHQRAAGRRERRGERLGQPCLAALDVLKQLQVVGAIEGRLACKKDGWAGAWVNQSKTRDPSVSHAALDVLEQLQVVNAVEWRLACIGG